MSMDQTIVRPKRPKAKPQRDERVNQMPQYNVILLNDDDHTYDYVIVMLASIFGHSQEKAFLMAKEVDNSGRVIVDTTSKERAELKQEQIHGFGADPLLAKSKGSMSAEIEPVE